MRVRRGRGVHPSKDILGTQGKQLEGKKIVLCITGSVAAYRAIDLARLLMKHSADVHAVMTESITSILSVALGSKIPIIVAPAMHEAMYENIFVQQNLSKLKEHMVFIEPKIEGGKAKVADPERILNATISILSNNAPLSGKRVLVTAGSTIEYIDPIRVITNLSSGKMGIAIAQEAQRMGATVTLVYGHGTLSPETGKIVRVNTGEEMYKAVVSELSSERHDIAVMAAAVADL